MARPKIKITLIDRKGDCPCHRGHKIGDSFDFDTERGQLCPMAAHVAFPYIDILRYGGIFPDRKRARRYFAVRMWIPLTCLRLKSISIRVHRNPCLAGVLRYIEGIQRWFYTIKKF